MSAFCANETRSPAEAAGVDVEQKMLLAAIDVHSATAKCKTRQVRLRRGIGFRLLSARYGDRPRSRPPPGNRPHMIHATLRYPYVEQGGVILGEGLPAAIGE
jgi:hypothetical protein